MAKLVIILNLDTLKEKNKYQFSVFKKKYIFIAFAYFKNTKFKHPSNCLVKNYRKSLFARLIQILKIILFLKNKIHHVEIYTGNGTFFVLENLVCRIARIPVLIVERGSPLRDLDKKYNLLAKNLRKQVYRCAEYIWIRELWMVKALSELHIRDYFFLSNAVKVPKQFNFNPCKKIKFIWCNSLKIWRNPEWFVSACTNPELLNHKAVMLGLLDKNPTLHNIQERIFKIKSQNLDILPFQDPSLFYLDAMFFVLPADIVYLNFSLLEAMSYGVVPIISDVEGAREIVDNGVDGFVIPHSQDALLYAMIKAATMDSETYMRLSKNARQKIINKFSIEKTWFNSMDCFYANISTDSQGSTLNCTKNVRKQVNNLSKSFL